MKQYKLALIISLSLLIATFSASANELKVGVIETAPFATLSSDNNKAVGIAGTIWQTIAEELHWKYQYIPLGRDYNQGIKMLTNHQIDALIGLVPVDHDARRFATFSRPFIISYNTLLVNTTKKSVQDILRKSLPKILYIISIILVSFLILAHICWRLEKKKGNPLLGSSYPKGMYYSLWFMMTAIFTATFDVPCRPFSKLNYFLATSLSSLFVLSVATLAVTFTSMLTISLVQPEKFKQTSDINNAHIAVIANSLETNTARNYTSNIVPINNLDEGIQLLKQNKVDGILDNYHVLVDYLKNHPTNQVHIVDFKINPDELAFAFAQNSPLELPFDMQLTLLQDIGQAEKICQDFLPREAAEFCAL